MFRDRLEALISRLRGSSLIQRLPLEILLEIILPCLSLCDLLALRMTSKSFFYLTHDFMVWKRMLEKIHLPLPPISPHFQHTPARDYHLERALIRASSLEKNWITEPCVRFTYTLETLGDKILEVALLPGGKYLVASMADVKDYQYHLGVFYADEVSAKQNNLLAKVTLPSRAYRLRARFMHYQGQQHLMVFYIRRSYLPGALHSQDPSTMSYDAVDLEHPLSYDGVCTSVALGSLEYISDPDKDRNSPGFRKHAKSLQSPFQWSSTAQFGETRPDHPSLCQYLGSPCVALCNRNQIIIVNFDTRRATHITCTDIGPGQKILALKILAAQARVLVVRADADGDRIELYAIPQASAQHATFPLQHRLAPVLDGRIDAAYISDMYMPMNADGTPWINSPPCTNPPISIYLIHGNVIATVNLQLQHDSTRTLEYDLNEPATSKAIPITGCLRILPGAYRPIAYDTEAFDRTEAPKITSWWRGYNTRNMDYAQRLFTGPQMACTPPAKEWDRLDSLTQKYLKKELEKGAQNLSWDEGSGRMCIAHGKSSRTLTILDFGKYSAHHDRKKLRDSLAIGTI